jgi:hypothetical protein
MTRRVRHVMLADARMQAHEAIARWLINCEMGDEGSRAGTAAAARVFDKLSQRLAVLITPIGAEALLARAVHLSRATFPFLDQVQGAPKETPFIARLSATAATVAPRQADEGLMLVLGRLIGLLESFIGQDLTLRLLRDVWPDLPKVPQTAPDVDQPTGKLEVTH